MMRLLAGPMAELEAVPADIAWKLVGTLFRQVTSMIAGASIVIVLGFVGYIGTGSYWYLIGMAYAAATLAWRYAQSRAYVRSPGSATPVEWAWRSAASGWAAAAGWGAWSAAVAFEPEKSIVIMVIGMHAGLTAGASVRNCAVPAVAVGQIILTSIPLFAACVASGNPYLYVYAGIVVMHIGAALALTKTLHGQTFQLLMEKKEKSDLVDRLEIAKEDLEVINHHLETLVATDALTNVANRRAFDLTSAREWLRSAREQTPMSMLLLDVDHFKAFNDFYGHQAGDACLQRVAAAIKAAIRRPSDLVARYGGEEFAVVLPGTHLDGAVEVGELIRTVLTDLALPHDASTFGQVTASIGVACMIPQHDTVVEQLTALADAALYAAKRSGRDRVQAADMQPVLVLGEPIQA